MVDDFWNQFDIEGNIDLDNRPHVKMDDGSIATVRSMSFNDGEREVLIPTVSDDGRIMSNKEAIDTYYETGNYFGKFKTVEDANKYAEQLHLDQEAILHREREENSYWNKFEEVSQNKTALENTNELSQNDPYVQTQEYQQEQLAHLLFSPEELKMIDAQGKMGWVEYRTRFVTPKDYLPGGILKQGADATRLLMISNKIENGETVSDADKEYMFKELRKQVEVSRRGLNWGAKAASIFVQAPAFMIEFALTGGLGKAAVSGAIKAGGAAATKAAIKAGTKVATSKVGAMVLGREATEKVGTRYALNVSAQIAGRTAGSAAILTPAYAYSNYGEMRIADGLNITDKGEMVFSEQKDGQLKTAMKAIGVAGIEVGSESMGGLITGTIGKTASFVANKVASTSAARGISAVSAKIYNKLPKETRIKLEASARVASKLTGEKAQAVGFHGVFGEMAEERAADILKVAFDLDDIKGYSADQWLEAFYPGHEELLLEAGLFSILGACSLSSKTILNDLKKKGYSEKEAQQIVNNLSENEKEHMANEILGDVSINEDITDAEVKAEVQAIQLKLNLEGLENSIENNDLQKENKHIDKNIQENVFRDAKGIENNGEAQNKTVAASIEEKTTPNNAQINNDESEETPADKIIRGESWFGKVYTDWVNRLTPIEALEEKASEKKNLAPLERPNLLARLYSGLVGATKQQIENNTLVITQDGNIKITGEGFLPILNDFDVFFKDVENNQGKRHTDLKNYLEAQRFLLDLQNRENFESTEEQKLEALKIIADLTAKYGDKINDFEQFADRIYKYQQRILHNLVDSGNMSEETYEEILKNNPHYIPFQRVIDEEYSSAVSNKSKFSGAKSRIKAIKGSERDIKDPFESILKNTYQIVDISYRNRIAKSIANLQEVLPEYITKVKPIFEVGTAKIKVAFDKKMRAKLEAAIKFFGGKLEYKKSLSKGRGLVLGEYSPSENTVRRRLGSQDRTLAHEFGHMLDFVFDIKNTVSKNKIIMEEISKLAEERFDSIVNLEQTNKGVEFVETKENQSKSYIKYVKSDREMIANMFDLYFTSREYMKKTAPTAYKFIENIFKSNDFRFLKDIRPSAETGIEEVEQEVWMPSKLKPGGNVVEYWDNGKRKFVEVTKPVMEAINDLSIPELNFIEKILTASSTLLRTGATIMPDFWVRNILRDQPIAFIQTRKTRPFIDMAKGLTSLLKKDNIYQEWMSSGGSFNSYMDLGDKSMREAVKELTSSQSKISKYAKSLGLKAIEDASMAFEQATRIGIYAREKLNSPALIAALEAREGTLDFGRSGKHGKYVNRYIPFFNAGIQGVDKLIRCFQNHPVLTSIKCLSAITLPSLAITGYYLYAAPDDDKQEYLEIPQWQKDMFWCFKLGDSWWRIPKPFEIGYIFGSIPERFMTWMYQKEMPEGKELFDMLGGFFNSVSPITDVGGFMPPILRVSVENIANYNFFTGRELYPKYLDSLEPAERKRKYTSETAQLLGQKLNVSPAKIENAISGLIGTSSRYLIDAGDFIINSVKEYNGEEINEKPSSLNDIPVIRSFVIREPQGYQTKSVNDFFDIYKELEQKSKTYKKKTGEEKREYYEKNKQQIRAYKRMKGQYDRMKDINKRIDKIYDNKNLSGDEKKDRIKPLAQRVSAIAFEANVWYRDFIKE